mgnify:CR=1 FL=1
MVAFRPARKVGVTDSGLTTGVGGCALLLPSLFISDMNFKEAKQAVCEFVNRPFSEMESQAGLAINAACRWAGRKHNFKKAERLATVLYPANTTTINIVQACDAEVKTILSAQVLSQNGNPSGRTIPPMEYQALQKLRSDMQSVRPVDPIFQEEHTASVDKNLGLVYGQVFFLMGPDFGLFPRPTQEVPLLLHFVEDIRELTEDEDTNFLLEDAWDFLVLRAVYTLNFFLKEDQRMVISALVMDAEWRSVLDWDNSLRTSGGL